jgi:hypothetical protein
MTHFMKNRLALLASLASLLLVGAGCGQTIAENVTERRINSELGTNGSVDIDDGTVNIKTNEGVFTTGSNVKLPADFPSEIPVYPGANVLSASTMAADNSGSLVLSTPDKQDAVMAWYGDKLSGWTKVGTNIYGAQTMVQYKKDEAEMTVMTGESDGMTSMTVIWTLE